MLARRRAMRLLRLSSQPGRPVFNRTTFTRRPELNDTSSTTSAEKSTTRYSSDDTPMWTVEGPGRPPQSKLSAAGMQLEREIQAGRINPLAHLRRGLDQGDVDFDTIRVCLRAYRSSRLIHLCRTERVEMIRADRIGGLVLAWLCKSLLTAAPG